jgi:uncharacterized protein
MDKNGSKKTVVIGASDTETRYSNMAVKLLHQYGHEVVPFGIRSGEIDGISIETELRPVADVHTVSLYVNPVRQVDYQQYIFELKPKRIIFNPGTENPQFEAMANEQAINCMEACTLVLLKTGQY